MGDRVDREEVRKANEVHVLDYLQSKGEAMEKQGHYYRHPEHDSLVVKDSGHWYWNSRSKGGYGAISFAREYYDMTFQDAVRDVNTQDHSKTFSREAERHVAKEFEYPLHQEVAKHENISTYLTEERKLNPKIVAALVRKGLLAEDKLKNGIFKWKDSAGKIVGGDRQGTVKMDNKRGSFKQIMANSKEDGGFRLDIGSPNKIALFESPIDALSYFELKRPENIRLLSMSGLKDQSTTTGIRDLIKDCKERGAVVEQVIFAVDNDAAGEQFVERWSNYLTNFEVDKPKNKDWNIDLVEAKTPVKQKEPKKVIEVER
ncbi:DUF3991 and TOPRIM domain-containing protein [Planococcus versutus]|uniref:DUF3991 domain-containing protein n=1 Tax=Planococcus versutus TaxID=1302659 RepID=A0A1B1S5V9_9BACL|nr:DUF3991 and TOPRIM domain-containing protein [Planococcus versutus]ANU28567.1 hypothetical protein I858_016425 [Planococcus versutus]